MKRAIYINPDTGVLAVVNPAYNDETRPQEGSLDYESDDDFFIRVVNNAVPDGVSYEVIEDTDLTIAEFLSDRTFREAWEQEGNQPIVSMPKARGIQMDKIRKVRNKELAKKDVEYMKALEADDGSSTAIAVEKQTLRDIPQTFDLTADTPEELKEKWPEGLPKE